MSPSPRPFLLIGALVLLAGCAHQTVSPQRMAGVAPVLSVERFLQAANSGDLDAMSRIFGTSNGAIVERTGNPVSCGFRRVGSWFGMGTRCPNRMEIELRMNAIAMILRHDDYRIRTETDVPGRRDPTTRVMVDMTRGPSAIRDVPFVVVRDRSGRWLIEEIGLERITNR